MTENKNVVGRAKLVKVRQPFKPSRNQWQYDGEGGSIRLYACRMPGAAEMPEQGYFLDLQTGEVIRKGTL